MGSSCSKQDLFILCFPSPFPVLWSWGRGVLPGTTDTPSPDGLGAQLLQHCLPPFEPLSLLFFLGSFCKPLTWASRALAFQPHGG